MKLSVKEVTTDEERAAVYSFRYRVYVEELGMTDEADHLRRWLRDDLDDVATSFVVVDEGDQSNIVGSLRLVFMDKVQDLAGFADKFKMGPALDAFGPAAICTTSRFVLDRRLRGGTSIYRLMRAGYDAAMARNVRLNFGDCSPQLLPFYERIGYRRYASGYNDTIYGFKVPILMLTRDRAFFQRVRSPLARLDANKEDDEEGRAWFDRTYPAYRALQSAALLPEEAFFDLLSRRIASDPLQELSILRGLDRIEASLLLGNATFLDLNAGDLVIRQGEQDGTLYALLSGVVGIIVGDEPNATPVTLLGRGDTFGEVSCLTGVPRSATYSALTACRVLVIPRDIIDRFIGEHPVIGAKVAMNLARGLAIRLSLMTDLLAG